jgi:hypothetical protein
MFQDLVASVREGSAILRGKATPSRSFVVKVPDAKRIRASYQLAQILSEQRCTCIRLI